MVTHLYSIGTRNPCSLPLDVAEDGEGVAAAFHDVSPAAVERHGGQDASYSSAVGNEEAVALHRRATSQHGKRNNSNRNRV